MIRSFIVKDTILDDFVKKLNKELKETKEFGGSTTADYDGNKLIIKTKKMLATSKSFYKIEMQNNNLTFIYESEDIAALHKPFIGIAIGLFKKILISLGATVTMDPPT